MLAHICIYIPVGTSLSSFINTIVYEVSNKCLRICSASGNNIRVVVLVKLIVIYC